MSIYLIYNDAFYQFVDYVFLGMLDFGANNKHTEGIFLFLFITNIVILIYWLFKYKFKNKELFFVLMFQLIMYPIFDSRHYVCALFPFLYLILKKVNSSIFLKILGVGLFFLEVSLLLGIRIKINFSNEIDFLRNNGDFSLLAREVKEYVGECDNFFFDEYYNYYVKLYYNFPIGQYDLLLSGNVGYNGMVKKLNELTELCNREKCYFFVEEEDLEYKDGISSSQYSDFYNYIKDNYVKVDSLFEFDIYTNYIE